MSRRAMAGLALAILCVAGWAEVREIQVDPLTSAEHWQIGGHRINYSLGSSSVTVSAEQTREGAPGSLKLTYDFTEPARSYVSAYHVGDAIPGVCRELSFWLYGDESRRPLRLSLEDARGRWFERDIGAIDWEGWRKLTVSVGDADDWRPLLRRGEERLPLSHPVNLRQIALLRKADAAPIGAVCLHDLRARTDVVPADFVQAELTIGRPANLFDLGETATVDIELRNEAAVPLEGELEAAVTDFFGSRTRVRLGDVTLPLGAVVQRTLEHKTDKLGTHEVEVAFETGDRERVWHTRFAVTRPAKARPADADATFGCMFNLTGFSAEQMATVLRLNRDAHIRWSRIGFQWAELNPAPGIWASDPPRQVEGPLRTAIQPEGQALRASHATALNCSGGVTIAFWARVSGANGSWQTVVGKWGPANNRNYGAYFTRDTGHFCFTGSFAKQPPGAWKDLNSGVSAWDDRWHHYAATYSAADAKIVLYVDGEPKQTEDYDGGELRTNDDDLSVGRGYPGAIDELLVYRRALTAAEAAGLVQKQTPPTEGLIAWWPFDENGEMLADRSGSGLHLARAEPAGPRAATLALENGIKTLGLLGFPPRWASTAPADAARPHVYEPDLEAWGDFVERVTRQYQDLVQHWEIWNEPNIRVFWEPEPDAADYLDVLKVAYQAAKRGNPECTVLMPGLAGPGQNRWGMKFLDELLEMGAVQYCDAISIHPYRQTTPEESNLVGDLEHIAEMAEKHGGRRPIWFTENCWTTQIPTGSTERRQALMLPRCYVLALGTGLIERLLWFRFHDPGTDRFYLEHNCGLCTNDLTPQPAYFAHRTVATLLDGADPDGQWDVGPHALARCFRRGRERVAAVWCPEGTAPVSIFVGKPKADAVDIMGNPTTLETRDGVVILDATEAVLFLTGLPPKAEARGTVLAASPPVLVRGDPGELPVEVRNPFPRTERASLSLTGPAAISLLSRQGWVDVPPDEASKTTFRLAALPTAAVGWHSLQIALEFAGRTFSRDIPVAVRSAVPDAGPVGYWAFDENEATVVRDSSGLGTH